MNNSLSSDDIISVFNGNINLFTYDQLDDIQNVDELLGDYGRAVILYFWKEAPKVGHWCCVSRCGNTVTFVDSYGSVPDKVLNEIPQSFKRANGQDYKYLSDMLARCPYQVHYNDHKWQSDSSSVCGRYCIVWLACCQKYTIERFQKLFGKDTTRNDRLVYELTKDIV
jgi:hypothetical protein